MSTCGIWLARSTLWAGVADDEGKRVETFPIGRTDEARWVLLAHLDDTQGLDCALVLTDAQARLDGIADLALQRQMPVWLAPWRIVDALRGVAGLKSGPPTRCALVARSDATAATLPGAASQAG